MHCVLFLLKLKEALICRRQIKAHLNRNGVSLILSDNYWQITSHWSQVHLIYYMCTNLTLGISLIQIAAYNEVIIFTIFRFGCGFCASTLIKSFADVFSFWNLQSIGLFVVLNPAPFEEQWSLKVPCRHPWGSFLITYAPKHTVGGPRHRLNDCFICSLKIKWTICCG